MNIKKKSKIPLILILIPLILILIIVFLMIIGKYCQQLQYGVSYETINIEESKQNKVYICRYKVVKNTYKGFFNYNEIWLEKSFFKDNMEKTMKVDDSLAHVVINFLNDDLFSKNIYRTKFEIKDDKNQFMVEVHSIHTVLFTFDSNIKKGIPQYITLFFVKGDESKMDTTKVDTTKIGELLLEKLNY